MKKLITAFIFSILILSLVGAAQGNGIGQNLSSQIATKKAEIKAGNYTGPQGQLLMVREIVQGLKEIRTDNQSATTDLNITQEQEQNKTKLKTNLSNGKEAEIKIMPDTAADRAIERLKLKVCNKSNNCTLVLKEAQSGNNKTAAYEIQVQRHYKILGLFKAKAENKAQVDATTGDIIIVKKPWWAFLASEQD